jgi:hypothetical protein
VSNDDVSYIPDTKALAAKHPNRHPDGRLKKGAQIGGGNPEAKEQYEARRLWRNAATEEEQLSVRAKLVERCLEGNMGAIRLYVEIMHGKQIIPIELSGPDGESIKEERANVVAVILGALTGHPEAKLAVGEALSGQLKQAGLGSEG